MAPTKRNDPLPSFLFGFKILSSDRQDDSTKDAPLLDYTDGTAFFKSVTGIKNDTDVTDFQEGGVTTFTRKVIGNRKWPNLVLKQGFTGDKKLWMWKWHPCRVDGQIFMLGPKMEVKCSWTFSNGYPVKWDGPELDATKNELAIETIEIAHEGLVFAGPKPPPPPPQPAPPPPPKTPFVDATVQFPTGSSTVPPGNGPLNDMIKALKDDPDKMVYIEGHTDNVGSASSNQTLSQSRADGVKTYLLNGGAPPGQIVSSIGYGLTKPIGDNSTADGRATNRRTTAKDHPGNT